MDEEQQDNLRALLTEAIIKVCQMEAVYTSELRIEGTVCVVSDCASVVIAHFTECVGSIHSFGDKRNDNSECAFEQHIVDGLSADQTELTLPEVKVEQVLPDEFMRTFEGVGDDNSISVMDGFCQAAERSVGAVDTKQTSDGQYQCSHCQKTCKLKQTLQSHMRTHHGWHGHQLHVCNHCSASFSSTSTLHMHISRDHGDFSECQQSSKKLADTSRMQHHAHHHCGVPLATKQSNSVENYSYLDANKDEMTRICLEADGADSLALLEALERKDYEKMIVTGSDTQLLMKKGTNMTGDQVLQQLTESDKYAIPKTSCSNLSKYGNVKATIMQYFEKVHVETPRGLCQYKCRLCHKMFKLRTSLYEHINSHTGKRRYACDQCGDRFVHHSSLHNHVNNKHMHASQRQDMLRYLCTGCDRRFKFRSQFERHLRSNPDHCTKVVDQL